MEDWTKHIGTYDLAKIAAQINGDGHLQLQDWRGLVSFYSKNKPEIDAMRRQFKALFGIEGTVYINRNRDDGYKLFFISKKLAQFLNSVGVIKGNKTNVSFSVPDWVSNGNTTRDVT